MSVIDTTENCRHCLMCRHMCPVGHVTHRESLTPHGWGQIVASEKRGLLEWNPHTSDVMFSCADCGLCQSHCVTSQPLPDAIAAVREQLVLNKLGPASVLELGKSLEEWENQWVHEKPKAATSQAEVALFVGDTAQHRAPDSLAAALKLLDAAGVQVALIGIGRSNGFISNSLGLNERARAIADANLSELKQSGARHLLVLSPEDFVSFNHVYPERLNVPLPEEVQVEELVSFLYKQVKEGRLQLKQAGVGVSFAYVDPTHTVRALERCDAARYLLASIVPAPPVELFWRKERAHPCGNGPLRITQPDIADRLTKARLEDAAKTGAQTLVTDCPGTLLELQEHADAYGLKVMGLYELMTTYIA